MSLAECSSLHNKRRFLSDGNGGGGGGNNAKNEEGMQRPFARPSCQKGVLKTANSRFDGRNRTKKDDPRLASSSAFGFSKQAGPTGFDSGNASCSCRTRG